MARSGLRTAKKAQEAIELPSATPRASTGQKRGKYGSSIVEVDGIKFRSKREARRWQLLSVLERSGLIRNIRRQVRYELRADGGNLVGGYDADFVYEELHDGVWELVVEDVKGFPTPLYDWKRRHMLAEHGIEIRET